MVLHNELMIGEQQDQSLYVVENQVEVLVIEQEFERDCDAGELR